MILAMATGRGCALVSGWAIPNATTQSVCDVCYSGALHHNLDVTFNIPLFPFFFFLTAIRVMLCKYFRSSLLFLSHELLGLPCSGLIVQMRSTHFASRQQRATRDSA